jgi:hypothetical protein
MRMTRVGLAAAVVLAAACGGTVAATGGDDGGSDARQTGPVPDAGSPPRRDASTRDVGPVGRLDAPRPPPIESGLEPDTGVVVVPDGGFGPDTGVDAGCAPSLAPTFTASPKALPTPACTGATIVAAIQNCFGNNVNQSACAPYFNTACWNCIDVAQSAAAWGPYVFLSNPNNPNDYYSHVNYGGCIAKLDPTDAGTTCGASYQEQEECFNAACVPSCPNADTTTAGYAALQACEQEAQGGDCATYQSAYDVACAHETQVANECEALIDGTQGDAGLSVEGTYKYVALFCEVPDGGNPFAVPVDAGSDARTDAHGEGGS